MTAEGTFRVSWSPDRTRTTNPGLSIGRSPELAEVGIREARSSLGRAKTEHDLLGQDLKELRDKLKDLRHPRVSYFPSDSLYGHAVISSPRLSSAFRTVMAGSTLLEAAVVTGIEEGVERVKLDLETETRHRISRDTEALSRTELLDRRLDRKVLEQANQAESIRHLQVASSTSVDEVDTLKEALVQEKDVRKVADDALIVLVRHLEEALRRESCERLAGNEDLGRTLRALQSELADERIARKKSISEVQSALMKDIQADREELKVVKVSFQAALGQAEAASIARIRHLEGSLAGEAAARSALADRTEARFAELSTAIQAAAAAKMTQAEEIEGRMKVTMHGLQEDIKSELSRMKDFVSERIEAARTAARESLREEISRERTLREEQHIAHQGGFKSTCKTLQEPLQQKLLHIEEVLAAQGRSFVEDIVKEAVSHERSSRETMLEQITNRERAFKASHSDLLATTEQRIIAFRAQQDDVSERQRIELRTNQAKSVDDAARFRQDFRQEVNDLIARHHQESVRHLERSEADHDRLASLEAFCNILRDAATTVTAAPRLGGGR